MLQLDKSTIASFASAAIALFLCGCAQPVPSSNDSPAHWQEQARTDLAAVRTTIELAHPGAIDNQNPQFRLWMQQGYEQALTQWVPQVTTYDGMLAAVRFYVAGFQDWHLFYSDNARAVAHMRSPGFKVVLAEGRPTIVSAAEHWPVPLPPIGAELLNCDGEPAATLVEQRVAPFLDTRDLASSRASLWSELSIALFSSLELRSCQFRSPSGVTVTLPVQYEDMPTAEWFKMMGAGRKPLPRQNRASIADGTLWIEAANFNLDPDGVKELETLLQALREAQGIKRIVFDVRRNGGGDSGVGERIFEAATGGIMYDDANENLLPQIYAQWRVSDVAITTVSSTAQNMSALYGEHSEQAEVTTRRLAELRDAKAKNVDWVYQRAGPRIDRAEMTRRHGHLRTRDVPIVLLTDSHCASACLNFADEVLQVPGSTQVGSATSADTVYIDVGRVELPSGNVLVLPLKVWRNTLRGNNQPLVPDAPLDLEGMDEATIRRQTLALFDRHR
jgi:hypothetical protein